MVTGSVVGHDPDPVVGVGHETDDERLVVGAAAQVEDGGILLVLPAPVLDAEADQLAAHLFAGQVHRQPCHVQRRRVESSSSHLHIHSTNKELQTNTKVQTNDSRGLPNQLKHKTGCKLTRSLELLIPKNSYYFDSFG